MEYIEEEIKTLRYDMTYRTNLEDALGLFESLNKLIHFSSRIMGCCPRELQAEFLRVLMIYWTFTKARRWNCAYIQPDGSFGLHLIGQNSTLVTVRPTEKAPYFLVGGHS